jgi:hypothetical protein
MFDDEEPKPGTLGESHSRTAAMPRLAASIHAERRAEVLDKGGTACRGNASLYVSKSSFDFAWIDAIETTGRTIGTNPCADGCTPKPSHFPFRVLPTASGNALWGGAEQCRLLGAKRKACALSEVYSF